MEEFIFNFYKLQFTKQSPKLQSLGLLIFKPISIIPNSQLNN